MNLDHHPRRKLLHDVGMDTLLSMRASGMTVKGMAEQLGVCDGTIYNHLRGYKRAKNKGQAEAKVTRLPEQAPLAETAPKPNPLPAMNITDIKLNGALLNCEISGNRIILQTDTCGIKFDQLDDLAAEIQRVKQLVRQINTLQGAKQ